MKFGTWYEEGREKERENSVDLRQAKLYWILSINGEISVCMTSFSTTAHPVNFKLCGCIAEHPRKCSVDCEVFWMNSSQDSFKHCFPTLLYKRKKPEPQYKGSAAPERFTACTCQDLTVELNCKCTFYVVTQTLLKWSCQLKQCIAQDTQKCSVDCDVLWMMFSRNLQSGLTKANQFWTGTALVYNRARATSGPDISMHCMLTNTCKQNTYEKHILHMCENVYREYYCSTESANVSTWMYCT